MRSGLLPASGHAAPDPRSRLCALAIIALASAALAITVTLTVRRHTAAPALFSHTTATATAARLRTEVGALPSPDAPAPAPVHPPGPLPGAPASSAQPRSPRAVGGQRRMRQGRVQWQFGAAACALLTALGLRWLSTPRARGAPSGPCPAVPLRPSDAPARPPGLPRRSALAALCLPALPGAPPAAAAGDPRRYLHLWPPLYDPVLPGYATRRTLRHDVGPDLWTFEQVLAIGPLQTPLRCCCIRLPDGGLWVHAPLPPTPEFLGFLDDLGPVAHIVVPSPAFEHKSHAAALARAHPDAEVWLAPAAAWAWPLDLPPRALGLPPARTRVLGRGPPPPWAAAIAWDALTLECPIAGAGPLGEAVFFHRASRTLVVTDAVAYVPRAIPDVVDVAPLLILSQRSTRDPLPPDTPANRADGWAKSCLLVSYFFPLHEDLGEGPDAGAVVWSDGYLDDFERLCERLLVPPVVRRLLFALDPPQVAAFADRVAQWDFRCIVPAHFSAPVAAGPADWRRAFSYLTEPECCADLPPGDMRALDLLGGSSAATRYATLGPGAAGTAL